MNNILDIIEVERLGKALAKDGDDRQSALINSFASELWICCRGDERLVETQICCISDKLTKTGEELIIELAEFVNLRRKEKEEDYERTT